MSEIFTEGYEPNKCSLETFLQFSWHWSLARKVDGMPHATITNFSNTPIASLCGMDSPADGV